MADKSLLFTIQDVTRHFPFHEAKKIHTDVQTGDKVIVEYIEKDGKNIVKSLKAQNKAH